MDFADAYHVYGNPDKLTIETFRNNEDRYLDIAMVEVHGIMLALVYVMRDEDVRVISFRYASRRERRRYEKERKK